jgi:hypothetical protein
VAAWGAAAPFAGPDFGYVADRFGAWQWSVTSACLGLGPGVVALLASLAVVAMATRTSYARRADLWVLGLVVTLCGAWFVVGQFVWPVVYGARFIAPASANHYMWKELAFAVGPGVILVFCGAVFMGWAVRRQLALVAVPSPRVSDAPLDGTSPSAPRHVLATDPVAGTTGTMAAPVATRVERPAPEAAETAAWTVAEPPTATNAEPPTTTNAEPPTATFYGSGSETFEPPANRPVDPPSTETLEPPGRGYGEP